MTITLLAEDSFLVREGISALLALDEELELLAGCASYDELMSAVEEHRPHVVITDIRMPPTQTDEVSGRRTLSGEPSGYGVVVLSQYVEPAYALKLFEQGSGLPPQGTGRRSRRTRRSDSTRCPGRFGRRSEGD